jgi:putative transposase
MARIARAVVPLVPHHITQRGNRRQQTFFCADDYLRYIDLMSEWTRRGGVDIWAYCLMPNHVHLVAVPESETGLRWAIGHAHRQFTKELNQRQGWVGYLWQGRFSSFAMDARHTLAAARYIELNPVRAGLVSDAAEYPWSSARPHLLGCDDKLVKVRPLCDRVENWRHFLGMADDGAGDLRKHAATGRPLGSDEFVGDAERRLGRVLRPVKPGPKPRAGEVQYCVPGSHDAHSPGSDFEPVASAARTG